MTWYDGGKKPPRELLLGKPMKSSGSLLVGSKGTLYSPNDYGNVFHLLPISLNTQRGFQRRNRSIIPLLGSRNRSD